MNKSIHPNSVESCHKGREGMFSKRERMILAAIRAFPACRMTDRQIMGSLRASDPNFVRPRISELIKAGVLEECGSTVCPLTRKRVRLVRRAHHETQEDLPFCPTQDL